MTFILVFVMIKFTMKIRIKLNLKVKKRESDYLKEFKNFANEQFDNLLKKRLTFPIRIYHL